jgi:hypothetical protein
VIGSEDAITSSTTMEDFVESGELELED